MNDMLYIRVGNKKMTLNFCDSIMWQSFLNILLKSIFVTANTMISVNFPKILYGMSFLRMDKVEMGFSYSHYYFYSWSSSFSNCQSSNRLISRYSLSNMNLFGMTLIRSEYNLWLFLVI